LLRLQEIRLILDVLGQENAGCGVEDFITKPQAAIASFKAAHLKLNNQNKKQNEK